MIRHAHDRPLTAAPRVASVRIPITDLGCASSDAPIIERVLRGAPGVVTAYLNPATDIAYVEYDRSATDPWRLTLAIAEAGYHAGPATAGPERA